MTDQELEYQERGEVTCIEDGSAYLTKAIDALAMEMALMSGKIVSYEVVDVLAIRTKEREMCAKTKAVKEDSLKKAKEGVANCSKFKKVEMPGDDSDSWLFRAERYFQICH